MVPDERLSRDSQSAQNGERSRLRKGRLASAMIIG